MAFLISNAMCRLYTLHETFLCLCCCDFMIVVVRIFCKLLLYNLLVIYSCIPPGDRTMNQIMLMSMQYVCYLQGTVCYLYFATVLYMWSSCKFEPCLHAKRFRCTIFVTRIKWWYKSKKIHLCCDSLYVSKHPWKYIDTGHIWDSFCINYETSFSFFLLSFFWSTTTRNNDNNCSLYTCDIHVLKLHV